MRVIQIAPPWFEVPPRRYGGTELVVAGLTDQLLARGHEVTVIASGGSRTRARLVSPYPHPPSEQLGDPTIELTHAAAVTDLGPVDLIHAHTLYGAVIADAQGRSPVVTTLHGPITDREAPLLVRLARRTHLVGISADQVSRAAQVRVRAVVHNGIDPEVYGRGHGGRGDRLLFLGRATPDKGPDLAVAAARRSGRPLDLAVKINEPEERAYWRDSVEPLLAGIDARVFRDADHATKVELLRHAHAVLVPIRWSEPFGLVMVEAAACGAPVVAFARGAAPEIVVDGETGRLVDPAAGVAGLAAAVEDVADIAPERCLAEVRDRFSEAAMADGYLEVYADAVRAWGRRRHRPDGPQGRVARAPRPVTPGPPPVVVGDDAGAAGRA